MQSLLHNEPHQYIANSLFDALKSFGSATKEKNKRDEEFKHLYHQIESFIEMRNRTIHNYVIIDKTSQNHTVESRLIEQRVTANTGYDVLRMVMRYTSKQTKLIIEENTWKYQ